VFSRIDANLKYLFYPVPLTNFDETSLIEFCFPEVVRFLTREGVIFSAENKENVAYYHGIRLLRKDVKVCKN